MYALERSGTSKPFLKGLSFSTITWIDVDSVWYLNHLRYRAEANLTDETKVSYPIGRNTWGVTDRRCGSFGEAVQKSLTLTICKEDQFTCDDGTCQPLDHRCDLKGDCADRSDEVDCSKVNFPGILLCII